MFHPWDLNSGHCQLCLCPSVSQRDLQGLGTTFLAFLIQLLIRSASQARCPRPQARQLGASDSITSRFTSAPSLDASNASGRHTGPLGIAD